MRIDQRQASRGSQKTPRRLTISLARLASRLDVAALLIGIVLSLALLGSLFPQMPLAAQGDVARRAAWLDAARARFGPATDLLLTLHMFSLGRAPLFVAAAGLLVAATLACVWRRWRAIWRAAFDRSIAWSDASPGSAIWRLSLPRIAAGADTLDRLETALVRRRYVVKRAAEGETLYMRADRHRWSRLGTLALHLAVPLMLAGALLSGLAGSRVVFDVGPGETVALASGPEWSWRDDDIEWHVRNDGFEVLLQPDGSPGGFRAWISPLANATALASQMLEPNRPLRVGRHTVYLSSYWGQVGAYGIELIVARDPGFVPFMAAGALLLIGMVCALYFPWRVVWARLSPKGELHLASKSSRHALGFEQEFAQIAAMATTADPGAAPSPGVGAAP